MLKTLGLSSTLRSARSRRRRGGRRRAPGRPSVAALLTAPKVDRVIRDAQNGTDPMSPAVVAGRATRTRGDAAVDEAFEYLGATWDFFFEVFARNSHRQRAA